MNRTEKTIGVPDPLTTQCPRLLAGRRVRMDAVAFARWLRRQGLSRARAAARLGLATGTLGRWDRAWTRGRLPIFLLGHPRQPLDCLAPVEVRQHLEVLGPTAGLSSLRALFPHIPRRVLHAFQAEYRRQWNQDHAILTEELTWTTVGAVWAVDFTQPLVPIDGRFPQLLIVRDLASQYQLLALPALAADARTAWDALQCLFTAWGPPLVLKADNGGSFIAGEVRDLLNHWEVCKLLSPPITPRYNGAVEAGNGPLKVRLFYEAARHGHPDRWTSDDVAAAVDLANATLRPWGPSGPTPEAMWLCRPLFTPQERVCLRERVETMRRGFLEEQRLEGEWLDPNERATVARTAIRRALESLGYLQVRRRRITAPFNSPLRAKIR